jgi:hypothetical protein
MVTVRKLRMGNLDWACGVREHMEKPKILETEQPLPHFRTCSSKVRSKTSHPSPLHWPWILDS